MSPTAASQGPATQGARPDGPRMDRIAVGVLLTGGGVGWILDLNGVSIPWRVFPAAAAILVGIVLLVTVFVGRGQALLVVLGAVAIVMACAVGLGVNRYGGPAGDRVLSPVAAEWPVSTTISAGDLTVDLTRHPLPGSGRLTADVGAGNVILLLPADAPVSVETTITAGVLTVDDSRIGDGLDIRWAGGATDPTVTVVVHVGLGNVEVHHAR